MDPHAAFPDPKRPAAEADLPGALGRAYAPLNELLARLRAAHADVVPAWTFSPRSGWHQIYSRKARRIFYLVPTRGDFRLALILGGKALAALQAGPYARQMPPLLAAAKRYPEGTAFSFNRKTLDVAVAAALIEVKTAG